MKAIDLYKTAMIMAGIDREEEVIITGKNDADELFYINKVLSDLRLPPISSLFDEPAIKPMAIDAVSAGIAYYLAIRACDRERTEFLCQLYNAKRASAMSEITRVKYSYPFKN